MEIITKPLKDLDIAYYNPRKDLGPDDPEYHRINAYIVAQDVQGEVEE